MVEGYLPVFSGLLGFLPTIVVLLVVVGLFENSAFALGFGCTTLAVGACGERGFCKTHIRSCFAKAPSTKAEIAKTARFLTFIPCSAKLPVLMFMCSVVLGVSVFGVVWLYLFSIFLGLLLGGLSVFRCPCMKRVGLGAFLLGVGASIVEFLKRISVGLVLAVTALYVLNYFNLLLPACEAIEWAFAPIGLNAMMISALVFGLVAKEMVIGVLLTFGVAAMGFTYAGAVSFLLFVLLYTPCIPTLCAMKAKIGFVGAAKVAVFNFCIAYGVSFIAYNALVLLAMM